jgi:hypothetical protein
MKIAYRLFSVCLALTFFAGCNGTTTSTGGRSRDFKSTTEPYGNRHPVKADINPNGTITCTHAMGKGEIGCYINTTSGGYQFVAEGKSISTGSGGSMILTCNGNGALVCDVNVKD